MLGWMILFGFMTLCSGTLIFAGHSDFISVRIATFLFLLLFVIGLLTRAVRHRTR
jgi:hypothetical protein